MLPNTATRRRYVDWAIRFTQGTPLNPNSYERQLLTYYVAGQLTLDQVSVLSDLHRLYPAEAAAVLQGIRCQQPSEEGARQPVCDAAAPSIADEYLVV